MDEHHQVPIWFFIGAVLLIYGVLILGMGIYGLWNPPDVRLAEYHADLWWSILMIALGLFYCVRFHPFGEQAD